MKKYQVFVSSTYEDLKDERKEVIQALLELDCIPVGMELFPATDDDQWTLIKELIEDCDYYILIMGGRYGSLNKEGMSYTQMEYEHAVKIGVPTISFLYKTPDKIAVGKTDKDSLKEEKLNKFKELVSEKMVKCWENPEELGSVVSRSLIKLIKTKPRIGWVKADRISSEESSFEILRLKQKIRELEEKLKVSDENDIKDLSQGEDIFKIIFSYQKGQNVNQKQGDIETTWNQLFSRTCTIFIDEASEEKYKSRINNFILAVAKEKYPLIQKAYISNNNLVTILIQLKALGLIEKSTKTRSVRDTNTYWKLTGKGDDLITRLTAMRKKS